jgi:hypothetical protein
MKKEFDFNDIGKTTPYRTPSNFFEDVQKKIMLEATKERQRRRQLKLAIITVLAAAAVIAGLIFIPLGRNMQQQTENNLAKGNVATSVVKKDKGSETLEGDDMGNHATTPDRKAAESYASRKAPVHVRAKHRTVKNDDGEWVTQLSDEDLSALTAMADNDEFLN